MRLYLHLFRFESAPFFHHWIDLMLAQQPVFRCTRRALGSRSSGFRLGLLGPQTATISTEHITAGMQGNVPLMSRVHNAKVFQVLLWKILFFRLREQRSEHKGYRTPLQVLSCTHKCRPPLCGVYEGRNVS